jgi:uncharacterized coiled-coil protein SlyX
MNVTKELKEEINRQIGKGMNEWEQKQIALNEKKIRSKYAKDFKRIDKLNARLNELNSELNKVQNKARKLSRRMDKEVELSIIVSTENRVRPYARREEVISYIDKLNLTSEIKNKVILNLEYGDIDVVKNLDKVINSIMTDMLNKQKTKR